MLHVRAAMARQRYTYINDRRIKYAWIADKQYVDTTNGKWYTQKGGDVFTPPSGCTFPTFSYAGGSKNYGILTGNGTSDLLSCTGPAALATGFKEHTVIVAYQLIGTVTSFMQICNFSNTSDTTDAILLQTFNDAGKTLRAVTVAHNPANADYAMIGSASNNNWHVAGAAFFNQTTSWQLESATYDGVNNAYTPFLSLNPSTNSLTLSKFNCFGFFGATKLFTKVAIRGILIADSNLSASSLLASAPQIAHNHGLFVQVS